MPTLARESQPPVQSQSRHMVLELVARNHPGVMLHICGLFARRAFNIEGILCLPTDNDSQGRIWLLVNEDQRLDRIVKQLLKLEDIRDVQRRSIDRDLFIQLERFFWPSVTV